MIQSVYAINAYADRQGRGEDAMNKSHIKNMHFSLYFVIVQAVGSGE